MLEDHILDLDSRKNGGFGFEFRLKISGSHHTDDQLDSDSRKKAGFGLQVPGFVLPVPCFVFYMPRLEQNFKKKFNTH